MVWVIAAVVALVVLVVAVVMMRKPAAALAIQKAEPASQPEQPVGLAATYDRVSCTLSGAVHGAMPPFGKLTLAEGALCFDASSRVVTKTGALADDGSATVQSLGSVEMGQFHFEWPLSAITGTEFKSHTVTIHCDGQAYQIEGLGGHGAALKDWLTAHGIFR
jgi:hypothetical protein